MGKRRGMPRKTDANQAEIVEALRKVGCCVEDMSSYGGGVPDLLVWSPFRKATLLFEVKNPKAKGKLNKLQQEWHTKWRGQVCVVMSVDEALREVGVVRSPNDALKAIGAVG